MTMAESPQSGRRALSGLFKSKAMKCLLTTLLLLGSTLNLWALGENDFYVNGVCYRPINPTKAAALADSRFTTGSSYEIPETITNGGTTYTVVEIGAFKNLPNLKKIVIPNTVTKIVTEDESDAAFSGTNLQRLTIPFCISPICKWFGTTDWGSNCYDIIYEDANGNAKHYYAPNALTHVTVTNTTTIPYGAFYGLNSVQYIIIPSNVTSIADRAFYGCNELIEIGYFPTSTLKSIGKEAFRNCQKLTNLNIPAKVTSVGENAFFNCASLTNVTINSDVDLSKSGLYFTEGGIRYKVLNRNTVAVAAKSYSGNVTISPTVEHWGYTFSVASIDNEAFKNCTELTSVTIPGITSIGSDAFNGCTGLSSITIPYSVTSVGNNAFANCTGLTSVTVNSETVDLSKSGLCFTKNNMRYAVINKYNVMVAANSCANNVTIPTSVTSGNSFSITGIAANAFKDCTTLSTINIPDNVTSVGANAFSGCTGLTSIIISSNANFSKSGLQFTKDGYRYLVLSQNVAKIITVPNGGTVPTTVTFGNEFTVTGIIPTEPNIVDGVYQIANAGHLYWFAQEVNSGNGSIKGILTENIVVNENVLNEDGTLNGDGSTFSEWTPIGTAAKSFRGTFDGNGHTVSGLYFNNTTYGNYPNGGKYVGLIGYAYMATIQNVGVIDSYLKAYSHVGGICGYCYNGNTKIINCYNRGTVSGYSYGVGGICGYGYNTSTGIKKCYNTGAVSGSSEVGGISGDGGTITNCYNTGTVSGSSSNVGGICGNDGSNFGSIYYSYNTGTVSGSDNVGGISGNVESNKYTNCYCLKGCASNGGGGTFATALEFASGKITYLLNGSTSQGALTWYQTIGEDEQPSLDNTHRVVYASSPCPYSNNSDGNLEHNYIDGFCICGDAEQPNSVDDVYQIANAGHLYWFASQVNSGNTSISGVLTTDIVVNENVLNEDGTLNGNGRNFMEWKPIGAEKKQFTGTFDGNGYTISGLYFNNTSSNYVGLFGYCDNSAAISNVGVIGSYIKGGSEIGGISGYGGTITNCYNTGTVSGNYNIGGICGYCDGLSSTIINCYNTGMISGISTVGGISGYCGTLSNCYNTGTVSGSSNSIGGICGQNASVTNCHNTGTVSGGNNYVGGINGQSGSITNCYNKGTVSGGNNYVGGISGQSGSITNCYNTGTVSGSTYVGGICGYRGTQTNCHNTGAVSGSEYVGGINGRTGTQTNCYFLEGCGDQSALGTSATAEEFANGKVAYMLNDNDFDGTTWRQTLYSDAAPVLDESHNEVTGYLDEAENVVTVYGNVALTTNYTVDEGKTLNIPAGASVTTTGHAVITNNGTIICNGTIAGNILTGNGSFVYDQIAENDITLTTESVPYRGSAYTIGNGIEVSYTNRTMCGMTFILGGSIAEPTYENNVNAGTATIHWGNSVSKQFTILSVTVSNPTIEFSEASYTYNGSAIEPTVTVKNGETIIDPSEYTVSYSNNTNAGTSATVTITDKEGGNYTVSGGSATFTINPKVVSSPTIELSATSFTYNGSAQTPTVTVKDGETTIPTSEYTVSYSSNTNAGTTATVTITDKANGNYTVSNCSATFTINPKVVSSPTIELSQTSYTYNGSAQTPTVTVKDGSTTIASGEYTVSYSNNTNAGTATVTIADKANGNYTVSGSATFTISPKVVSSPTIALSQTSYTYDGSAKTPTVSSVKDGSTTIASDEYTVSYSNNTNAGTATVTIADKANGNYTVRGEANFTISPKVVSSPTIALSQTSYTYDGSAKTPTVSSVKDGSTIIASGEYTVSYSNNTNAGTATVTIADKANGNYTVSGSATFTISPKEVSSPTIEFSDAEITYTGSALTPTITVKDGSTVIPTSEYTVSYSNNTNAGTANLTITDKANGNYAVSGETTFTINPKTVSNPTIILSQTTFIYDGTAKSPTVTSVKDGSTVIPTSEYTVTMPDDAVSVGDYTVEIEDIDGGNYNVSGTATYVINLCTEHQFDNFGQCTVCGEYTQPELVDGVYQIASAAHLYWFASWVNKGNAEASAVLTADIVVNSSVLAADGSLNGDGSNFRTWTPIGIYDEDEEYFFSGTFDGDNHTISGLYLADWGNNAGLFGFAEGATIKNVGIVDSYFSGVGDIGSICGFAYDNSTITNCYNTGTVSCEEYEVGGICGYLENSTITNCHNTGTINSGEGCTGGICGYAYGNNTISNCYNTGSVTSKYGAGGICGVVSDNSAITNCHNEGTVSCEVYDAGGICGDAYENITITNCYNTGTINSGEECAGGICGYFEGECTITNCFNTGTVTGPYFVGGVCCVFTDELELSNNFYLAGCATVGEGENAVVQNGVGVWQGEDPATDVEGVTAATASEFAGGHIAYLLNNSEQGSGVWYQTLFADASPVLDAEHNSPTGYITEEGSVVTVVGSVVVESAYEVANGKTLNIPVGASLTTRGNGVITNNGTIVLNGTLAGNDLAGEGNFIYGGQIATADLVLNNNANYVYKGSAYDDIEFTVSRTICGKVFTYGDEYTVSYANNINAGQATISLTNNNDAENVVSSHFTIKPIEDEVVVTVTLADKSVAFSGAAQTYNSEDALTIEANNELYNLEWIAESGNAASVSGTNAAEYAFGWNAEMFSNTSDNFTNVRFDVTDGKLIITPNTEVVVTVTENSSTLTYNGEEQSVSGYSVAISDATGVYTEDDIAFSGNATASGINAGVYQMQLSAEDFSNTNKNFADVTFNIVDGALTINRAAEAPNKPEATMETRYINTQLVALPADWAWSGNKALELGDNSATANYAGADKGNYVTESVEVTITRTECPHNEGNELLYTLDATCTHKGYTGNTSCKLCGQIYEMGDSIPALGHDFVETVVAPTCTADGYTEHLCNRCQHIEYSDTVAATGHKADSVVFENVVAATCTEAGSKDSVVYCSVCQIELSRTKVVISAGHKAGAAVAENLKAATCTEAGSVDSVVYCTVCKEE